VFLPSVHHGMPHMVLFVVGKVDVARWFTLKGDGTCKNTRFIQVRAAVCVIPYILFTADCIAFEGSRLQ